MRRIAPVLPLLLLACSSEPTQLTLEITTGHEQDGFAQDPPVTRIEVAALDVEGQPVASATTAPGGSFSLGELATDELVRFEAQGYDAGGAEVVRGGTVALLPAAVQSDLLPLFVGRLDQWARPPGELPASFRGGLAAAVGERYLLLTGGSDVAGQPNATIGSYDLLALGGSAGGTLSQVPESLVVSSDGDAVLFVDAAGASWVDFAAGQTEPATPPVGLVDFAPLAGGRTVRGPNASYLVGATRTDTPSEWVLVVAPDRSLAAAKLTAPRRGAAAAWLPDTGLAVVGGSDTAPGLELLAEGADSAVAHPYPPDATEGAAAVPGLTADELLIVCGQRAGQPAAVRSILLGCATDCVAKTIALTPPIDLVRCQAFATARGPVLLVGQRPSDDQTLALSLELTGPTATPLPLREPRLGATAAATPTAMLALLGGVHPDGSPALTVEMLAPR